MSSGPSPRKRVLLVASSGNLLGGAEHCLVDVVSGMQGSDWEPIVAVPSEGTLAAALRRLGAIVWVVDLGVLRHRGEAKSPILALRMVTAVAASRKLTKMIRQHDVRIVHSNAATVVAGALAARSARVPHVWHVRELLGGPAWKLLRRAMYAGSARIVCISDTVARHVTDGRASAVVTVIHDGIDLTLFHPAEHAEPGADVVMMSRIHPDKGHEQFIRAAAVVAAHTPAARFVIYGDCLPTYAPLRREFEALIEELGLSGRAQIMPGLTRAEVATTLRTADVVVVPSTWVEPGGLVVLEGMASAAPVIAPDRGGPAEVITDGVDGFLVAPTNTAMLAATIERLLADPDLRRVIGRRALERVTAEYGLDTQIPRLTRLYDELTSTTEWRQCA